MSFGTKREIPETILLRARSPLRFLADHVDWELLPGFMQDAVDHMLADEARAEQGNEPFTPLDDFLSQLGIESDSGTSVE